MCWHCSSGEDSPRTWGGACTDPQGGLLSQKTWLRAVRGHPRYRLAFLSCLIMEGMAEP